MQIERGQMLASVMSAVVLCGATISAVLEGADRTAVLASLALVGPFVYGVISGALAARRRR